MFFHLPNKCRKQDFYFDSTDVQQLPFSTFISLSFNKLLDRTVEQSKFTLYIYKKVL